MINRWEQGRAEVDRLLDEGRLQRVPPSHEHAERLIEQAELKLRSAVTLAQDDPASAFVIAYDAARLALTAILADQGLRPHTEGGHVTLFEAVRAQLDPPMGAALKPFDRLRRTRNDSQYPRIGSPDLTAEDVASDIETARGIVDIGRRLVGEMPVY